MAASIATIKQHFPEIKGYTRAHGWDVYCERHPLHYLPLRTHIMRNLDTVFFIAQNGKDYYSKLLPQFSSKYTYSALGTKNHGIINPQNNSSTFNMFSCSNIIPLKNLSLMIDALSCINDISINWVHFGTGPNEDEIILYAKQKLAAKQNIEFDFKGFVFNDKIHEYLAINHIDFLINCSTTEGVPVSMMEAMSFGVPVIGTNVGGVSEIISDSQNGYLLSAMPSKQEVAATITKLCNLQPKDRDQMRQNAFTTWNTKFNADINYAAFISMIK